MQSAIFILDDSPDFKGIHNPEHLWNGFNVPMFDIETLKEIVKFVNSLEEDPCYSLKEQEGVYSVKDHYYPEEGFIELKPFSFNGVDYYSIDSINCWSLKQLKKILIF